MASAYPCHSPAFTHTLPITCKPAIAIANLSPTLHIPRNNVYCCGVQRRHTGLFPPPGRGHIKVSLKVADSYPKKNKYSTLSSTKNFQTGNMDKDSELVESNSDSRPIGLLSMRDLISSYKEALLNGVTEDVYLLESVICNIEREKNELANKAMELTAELDSAKEKFFRLNADLDNFRKQSEKERIRFTNDIQADIIKSLLPIVDSFEKAKQHIKPKTEKEKKIDASYRGIYKQFVETMRAFGVSAVVTTGRQFDPLVHEAVARVGHQQFKEGIIIEEIRRGFLLKNQVVRQAAVKVSSGPGNRIPSSSLDEAAGKQAAAGKSMGSENSDTGST